MTNLMVRTASLIFLLLTTVLFAGCRQGSGNDTRGTSKPQIDEPTSFRVEGRVASPTLAGARVSLHPVVDGKVDWQTELSGTSTNANGGFLISLDMAHLGSPAVLAVRDRPGETAVECILVTGCNGTQFGAFHPLTAPVTLRVGIPALTADAHYNPTLLTELALTLAEAEQTKSGGADLVRLIKESNNRVASRFGVIGLLPSQPTLDIADRTEVQAAGNESIKYAAMGPAIIAAVLQLYPEKSIPEAMNHFITQYGILGIANNSNIGHLASFEVIYEKLVDLIDTYEGVGDVDVLVSELSALKILAAHDELNRFDQGTVSGSEGLPTLEKAKIFVRQVRQIASSIDLKKIGSLSNLSNFVDGSASDALDSFGVETHLDDLISSDQSDVLTAGFKKVLYSALHIIGEHYAGHSVTSPYEGVPFRFTDLGDREEIVFLGMFDACDEPEKECLMALNMTLTGKFDRLTGNVSSQAVTARSIDLKLSGGMNYSGLSIEFFEAEQSITTGPIFYTKSDLNQDGWQGESHSIELEKLAVRLPFRMVRVADSGDVTFTGLVGMRADVLYGGYLGRSLSHIAADGRREEARESQFAFDQLQGLNLEIGALLDNQQGETFVSSLNLKQGQNVPASTVFYVDKSLHSCSASTDSTECTEVESNSGFEGESESNFLGLTATAIFKANLKGVAEPVMVGLSGSRESPERNKINHMKVTYPGHALVMDGEFTQKGDVVRLNAVDLEGMQMKLDSDGSKKRSGNITDFEGNQQAIIKDMGTWIKITFLDGYFESML